MSNGRTLDSEQLGALGETEFISLCERGIPQLVVNKATRDKHGWDFVVEFPRENIGEVFLDARPNPVSARFQQKTLWAGNDRIRFRLTALERLAKDPGPAFVCALKFDEGLRCVDCYLIHLLDENLAFVLERLRRHEADGGGPVNRVDIDLYASQRGLRIEPTHASLIAAIRGAVGEDVLAYHERKKAQIQTLGYDVDRFAMSFGLPTSKDDELVDAMLGIGGEIEVVNLNGVEHRFGIALPMRRFEGAATMTITPTPIDTCDLIFHKGPGSARVIVPAVVYGLPPGVVGSADHKRMRFAAQAIEVVFRKTEGKITAKNQFHSSFLLSMREWNDHFKIMAMFCSGKTCMDIRRRGRTYRGAEVNTDAYSFDSDHILDQVNRCEKCLRLFDFIGVVTELKINFQQLQQIKQEVELALAFFLDGERIEADSIKLDQVKADAIPEISAATYVSYINIGDERLVFAVPVIVAKSIHDTSIILDIAFDYDCEERRSILIIRADEYENYVESYKGLPTAPLVLYK